MTENNQKQLGKTLWAIADQLRGAMNADDFRDYMLAFLFLRYLSDNYERAARKELGRDYPDPNAIGNGGRSSLSVWYAENPGDVTAFEKQMRLKAHYVVRPEHLWTSIAHMARTQDGDLELEALEFSGADRREARVPCARGDCHLGDDGAHRLVGPGPTDAAPQLAVRAAQRDEGASVLFEG